MVFDNPYLRKFLGLGGVIRRFFSSYKTSPTIESSQTKGVPKYVPNLSLVGFEKLGTAQND